MLPLSSNFHQIFKEAMLQLVEKNRVLGFDGEMMVVVIKPFFYV